MLTKAQINAFIFNWLKTESNLVVIQANQKGPRPARPYISLLFINPSSRLGSSIDQQSMTVGPNTVATEGLRKAVASINVFGENAVDTLAKLRDSLDRPDIAESFEAAGITHLDESQINDLTSLEETLYEERAQMDLVVAFVAGSEVDVSTIEKVQFSGSVNAVQIPQITVNST